MNQRTRAYLQGRFGDYYRRTELSLPPAPGLREWGFIPFTEGPGTTMVRHKALVELGDLSTFLVDESPRHVYFSAGQYDDPGARSMADKGWLGSDLVFDLDADHLPAVDPETDSYAEMLATCKAVLLRLLEFLRTDFGFEDDALTVVFSGSRGYHVHVRTDAVRPLDRDARSEIAAYLLGEGITGVEALTSEETVAGLGRSTPAQKHTLRTAGGWGRRVHDRLCALVETIQELDETAAIERLHSFDGIGEKGGKMLYQAILDRPEEFSAGNLDVAGQYSHTLANQLLESVTEASAVPIDEPVTTDINRLIRLPGSIHGGSGLAVCELSLDGVESFSPLREAVPEAFTGAEITITNDEQRTVQLSGETHKIPAGNVTVRESIGIFLMTRGHAEKAPE